MLKKLLLILLFATPVFGQSHAAIITDFRKLIGEPNASDAVTDGHANAWMNMATRELGHYGAIVNDVVIGCSANRDTFDLPADFGFELAVTKTLKSSVNKIALMSISRDSATIAWLRSVPTRNLFERTDTVTFATGEYEKALAKDVYDVARAYRRTGASGAVRFLSRVPVDSVPGRDMFERTDTVVFTAGQFEKALKNDVYGVRMVFRKNKIDGQIKTLTRIPSDSTFRIGSDPNSYYMVEGQPSPRLRVMQASTTTDTLMVDVMAVNYFTVIGQPFPRIRIMQSPLTADSIFFLDVMAIMPRYYIVDNKNKAIDRHRIILFPPLADTTTLLVTYVSQVDSMETATNVPYNKFDLLLRDAVPYYMAARYYEYTHDDTRKEYNEKRWMQIATQYAVERKFLAAPTAR